MTAGAAIAPVAGYDRHRRASRMMVVGVAYFAVVAAGAIYPLVSPLRDFWDALPPPEIAANALAGLVWLPILLVAFRPSAEGPTLEADLPPRGGMADRRARIRPELGRLHLRQGERCRRPGRLRTSHRERPIRRPPGSVRSGRRGLRLPARDGLDPQGDRVRLRLGHRAAPPVGRSGRPEHKSHSGSEPFSSRLRARRPMSVPTRSATELQVSCYQACLASLLEVPSASSWSQLGRSTRRTLSWPVPATPARLPASSRHALPCSGGGSRRAEERLPTESSRHRSEPSPSPSATVSPTTTHGTLLRSPSIVEVYARPA